MLRSLLLLLLLGCAAAPEPAAPPEPPAPAEASAPAEAAEAAAPSTERAAARHILVAWQGAVAAPPTLRRTRAEAEALAQAALARVRAGEDFATVATQVSEDATRDRGGFLGAFSKGDMDPAFERATFALQPGQVSGLVESPFGFHIILREPLDEIHLSHLVVQWAGLPRTTATRTRAEAEAILAEAQSRLDAGEPFDAVVAALSDGPASAWGGDLGWFLRGDLAPPLEQAAFSLKAGQTSAPIESPKGLHLLHRIE